eukprot:128613_1
MGNEMTAMQISGERIKYLQEHKPSPKDDKACKALYNSGTVLFQQRRFMEAIAEFTKAIDLCPGMATIYRERSKCYLQSKRYKEALNDGLMCTRLAPNWAKGDLCVAMALFAMDRPIEAAKAATAGLKIDPNDAALQMIAAECPKRQKELKHTAATGMVADWEKNQIVAMSNSLTKEQALKNANKMKEHGNSLLKKGLYGEAVHQYSLAILMCPDNHVFYSNRCAAFVKMERFDQALSDAQKCIDLKPDWIKGYFRTINALLKLGEMDEARQVLKQARPIVGRDAQWSSLQRLCPELLEETKENGSDSKGCVMEKELNKLKEPLTLKDKEMEDLNQDLLKKQDHSKCMGWNMLILCTCVCVLFVSLSFTFLR